MDTASFTRPGLRASHLLAVFALAGVAHGALAGPALAQGDSWNTLEPMPTPRRLLAAAVEGGAIYTFGGCGSPCFDPPLHTSTFEETRLEVYEAGSWTVREPIPVILFGAAATAAGNGKIYVFGGFVTGSGAYEYDPRLDAWKRKTPMPTPRHGLAAVALNGKVYVLGGSNGSAATGALEVYDPALDEWSQKAPMPTPRVFLAAAAVNGRIYAIGGSPDCCGNSRTDAVEVYDPVTDRWSSARPLPVALQVSAAAVVNGRIYVFGGFIPGSGIQGSTFEYDPVADAWTSRASMLEARDQAPAVVLGGVAHVLGGSVSCHCRARATHDGYTPPASITACSVSITKTVDRSTAAPGDGLRYQISVHNDCPVAVEATVTDDLATTGLTGTRWCSGSGCTPSSPGNLADDVTLPANGTATYEVAGTVPCTCGKARIDNTACVKVPGRPEVCETRTVSILPAPGGDLALTVTGPGNLTDCSVLPYILTVANKGPGIACGAVLRVQPPAGSALVSTSSPCAGLPCGLGNIAPGSQIQVTATFTVPALHCPAALAATASVTACNSDASTFETKIPCILSVTKSDGLDEVAPGDPILYTIGITNQGCAALSGAVVTDTFPSLPASPAGLQQVRWCRGAACTPLRPEPLLDMLDLPPGGMETYLAAGTVALLSTGILSNTVSVLPPGSAQVSATDVTHVVPSPGLTALCEEISGSSFEGGMITKTFVISNSGPAAQGNNAGPEFEDALPAGLSLVSAIASSGTVTTAANTVSWNGSIPGGGTVTVQIMASIDAGTQGMRICNGATTFFDANGDGVNESSRPTPVPCCLEVLPPGAVPPIPSLSGPGLAALALLLSTLALVRLRRRGRTA